MKKLLCGAAFTAMMIMPTQLLAADYIIDSAGAHASINFKVSHLGYSFIQGRFNTFDGMFSYDPENIEDATVQVNVNTQSLDSNHAERDKHQKSKSFINASTFSTAQFISTKVKPKSDQKFTVIGNLTLHGITKKISIDANFIGAGKDPWGGQRAGFQGTTRLQLADFGIPVVGASSYVDMNFELEGIRK